jgi:hypothetical protein
MIRYLTDSGLRDFITYLNLFRLLLNYIIDLFSTLFQYSSNSMNSMLYNSWYLSKIYVSLSKLQNSTGTLISFISSIPIIVKNSPAEQKKYAVS